MIIILTYIVTLYSVAPQDTSNAADTAFLVQSYSLWELEQGNANIALAVLTAFTEGAFVSPPMGT